MVRNKEVDKYYSVAPSEYAALLTEIRAAIFEILADVPEMSENFSYQIAVYKYGNKPLFSIAYFKDHCSFISQDKEIAMKIPELKNYKISGTSIHFTPDHPLSRELLDKIIHLRLEERRQGV